MSKGMKHHSKLFFGTLCAFITVFTQGAQDSLHNIVDVFEPVLSRTLATITVCSDRWFCSCGLFPRAGQGCWVKDQSNVILLRATLLWAAQCTVCIKQAGDLILQENCNELQ